MTSYSYKKVYTGPVKAAVIDWDGTIVDHGSFATVQPITELFRSHGVQVSPSQIRATAGTSLRSQLEALADMDQIALQWESLRGYYPNQRDIYSLHRELIPLVAKELPTFSQPVSGALNAIGELRNCGLMIGTTSCLSSDLVRMLSMESSRQGFEPDTSIGCDQVPNARPHPWMCFKAALEMQLYPMESIVKIGDTAADIDEGLNAGMWTVAVAATGNEIGMNEHDWKLLHNNDKNTRIIKARESLSRSGAHFVIDSLEDAPAIIKEINRRLSDGEHP